MNSGHVSYVDSNITIYTQLCCTSTQSPLKAMANFPSDEKTLSKIDGPHHDIGDSSDVGLDKTRERKLLRKIDLFVIPILGLLYLMAFLDRFVFTISSPLAGTI